MVRHADLNEPLKQGSRSQSSGGAARHLRSLLVVAETALTIVLLMGAGLMLKSFVLLVQVDPGLDPHHVLTADLLLSKRYGDTTHRDAYIAALLDSIGSLPGVERVAAHTDPPFQGGGSQATFTLEGHADPDARTGHLAGLNVVSAEFFATVGMPIARGRAFDRRDGPNSEPVAVINETMARRFWPNSDPIGKRLRLYYDRDSKHWLSIVGVARDVRYRGRELDPIPQVFLAYEQRPYRSLSYPEPYVSLVVRTTGDPSALANAVQARIWAVDKDQPVMHLMPMERLLAGSSTERRAYLMLLGIFAAIALVMATAGIYGLSAYAVVCRTQEMGIRIALGATRGQILALVLRRGMLLTLVGIAIGIASSLALTRLIAGFLYGITPTDASTFVGTALLFAVVAWTATYIPARRAATIDPTIAFRAE